MPALNEPPANPFAADLAAYELAAEPVPERGRWRRSVTYATATMVGMALGLFLARRSIAAGELLHRTMS